jgi:hypothetical protein
MSKLFRRAFMPFAALAIALGGFGVLASAPAHAGEMNINATGGDGTAVDKDGTQGSFNAAVQGTQRSGDQDAYANDSWEALPQYKAGHK